MKCMLCGNHGFETISKKVRYDIPINVIKCKKCALITLENPMKKRIDYTKLEYRSKYNPKLGKSITAKEMFDLEIKHQQPRINRISSLLDKNSTILEIGSASGYFLYSVRKRVHKVVGIELNPEHVSFCKHNLGIQVYDKPLDKLSLKENTFDVIFMFHAFEHMLNPIELLQICRKLLKPNGIIYVEVPNIDSVLINVYKITEYVKFHFIEAESYYYSEKTLKKLFAMLGFTAETKTIQEYSFFNHINWLLNKKPQSTRDEAILTPNIIKNNKKSKLINKFLEETNTKYIKFLEQNGLGDTLCCTAKIKR